MSLIHAFHCVSKPTWRRVGSVGNVRRGHRRVVSAAWDPSLIVGAENRRVRSKGNDKNAERNLSDDDLTRGHYDDGEFWVAHNNRVIVVVVVVVLRLYLIYMWHYCYRLWCVWFAVWVSAVGLFKVTIIVNTGKKNKKQMKRIKMFGVLAHVIIIIVSRNDHSVFRYLFSFRRHVWYTPDSTLPSRPVVVVLPRDARRFHRTM